ncbi:hypothetical protein C1H46_017836 [Malus baccata]|uniref:Pentacotripeptide-repeat region of PRORP domain-containing protein n=1 Tax=Malus baccata TaxID=106549 RepID=A0A540MCV9_MALBA|nr:hypothetical protein C1H46_017836 [Malus baccata]
MPPSYSRFIPKGLSISQIQRFIPKSWKEGAKQFGNSSALCISEAGSAVDDSMIDSLLTSIKNYASQGNLSKAFKTVSLVQLYASSPTCDLILHSISSVILSCANHKTLPQGEQLHAHIVRLGFERHPILVPKLVKFYSSFNLHAEARIIIENSNILHPLPWNVLISSYVKNELVDEALSTYKQMVNKGIRPDCFTYPSVLKACGEKLDISFGREVGNSWCKDLRKAYTLFQLIEDRSIITWNSMLSGYSHMDRAEEASFLFREMLCSGIEPNYVTIASILPLCARVANLQHGKEFHCYITKRVVFDDCLLLWNALVDMYARSGKVLQAKRVFDSMSKRDEVTYTSMIAGYGVQGEGKAALKLFEEMNLLHIKPDHVTMVSILSACSHSGLVIQGQMLFEKMLSVYGITPDLEHCACMVDLFGRAGLLNKAKEVITRMPYKPTSAMWATLIGACRIHGNMELGEWAAGKLLEMRPENSGYYVLIANMYAAAGCWNNLARVRTFMRDLGVRKDPGCAWVDVGDGFSPFLVGDTTNRLRDEIYLLLDGLTELMKDTDFVVNGDISSGYDVFED